MSSRRESCGVIPIEANRRPPRSLGKLASRSSTVRCVWSETSPMGFGTGPREAGSDPHQLRRNHSSCVCVCVFLLYSIQLGGQRSPLSTTAHLGLPSTQLKFFMVVVRRGKEKGGENN